MASNTIYPTPSIYTNNDYQLITYLDETKHQLCPYVHLSNVSFTLGFNTQYEYSYAYKDINGYYDIIHKYEVNQLCLDDEQIVWNNSTVGNAKTGSNEVNTSIRKSFTMDGLYIKDKVFKYTKTSKTNTTHPKIRLFEKIHKEYHNGDIKQQQLEEAQSMNMDVDEYIRNKNINILKTRSQLNTWIEDYFEKSFNSELSSYLSTNKNGFSHIDFDENEYREWKVLQYNEGCKFEKHSDGQKNERHIGKWILLPPLSHYYFEGGDLVLYDREEPDNEEKKIVIYPHDTLWTLVFIHIGQLHEIKEVTKGTRYSIVCDYCIPKEVVKMMNSTKYEDYIPVSFHDNPQDTNTYKKILMDTLKEEQSQITALEERIKELKMNILGYQHQLSATEMDEEYLFNPITMYQTHPIIQRIYTKNNYTLPKDMFAVVCSGFYNAKNLDTFSLQDKITFNALVRAVNTYNQDNSTHRTIKIMNARIKLEKDEFEDRDIINIRVDDLFSKSIYMGWSGEYHNDEDATMDFGGDPYNEDKMNMYYVGRNIPGYLHAIESEYNDSTYDTYNYLKITLLVVS